ncbi:MAG: GNAT family N-acetyltransferase [Intrasporangium sp.]|uniref:GNAT family N-acetyltransferase n=1 Tax=Intrasporangium sp. TaxID=1925024 RepID=UPI00264A344A|nr:GNAT family N-acetyltransferase [Intrasporangium sp.]MDN5797703.1 GNAT family N-acetyltransferase [Intrasporangium sp.]
MDGPVARVTRREVRVLTPDRVTDLVGPCAPCTYWQTVPRNGHRGGPEPLALLADWVAAVTDDWGPPGRVVYVDGAPVGHVLLAPARQVPRLAAFATGPSDPSTLMLVAMAVADRSRGRGLYKALVQAAAKDAVRHKARSLDAIGAGPSALGHHPCIPEVADLERAGFHVQREHPTYPRLRLDLRNALTLRDEAAELLSRALARVPKVHPVPEAPHPDGATRARLRDED